jgi:hypothetical protein
MDDCNDCGSKKISTLMKDIQTMMEETGKSYTEVLQELTKQNNNNNEIEIISISFLENTNNTRIFVSSSSIPIIRRHIFKNKTVISHNENKTLTLNNNSYIVSNIRRDIKIEKNGNLKSFIDIQGNHTDLIVGLYNLELN